MVYVSNWVDFLLLAGDIFKNTDKNPRYVIKLKKKEKQFILKVTDDEKCIKFKISQSYPHQQVLEMNETFMKWCNSEIYGCPKGSESLMTGGSQVKKVKKKDKKKKFKKNTRVKGKKT